MKPHHQTLLALGLVLVPGMTLSNSAHAVSRFPSLIYHHLYSYYTVPPYQPPCSLCHVRGSTGPGTAQTPFALSMKARGLDPNNNNSVAIALDAMQRDNVDSDGDGVPDIQEIEDDTDPNTPAEVSLTGETGPKAGCGGQSANHGSRTTGAMGLLIFTALGLLRRRQFIL
jgi:MYXO-CTERM domain-containing protein